MCMFSLPVLSVGDTQIFARFSGAGTQFLAYQMTYESEQENAMILPIPVRQDANEDSVRFINLENYHGFFDSLDKGFPSRLRFSISCGGRVTSAMKESLAVVDVGSYVASFVPSLDDFSRLDDRFGLPSSVWDQLPQYCDYGFAVFQLKEGNLKPHPIAFEFETRDESELFFPTVHVHDGEVHDKEYFQHLLYMQHAGFDSRVRGYVDADVKDKATGVVRSAKIAGEFCDVEKTNGIVVEDLLVHRKAMRGELQNVDYRVKTFGHATKRSFNWNSIQWMWPWMAIAGCCAWFFARRNRIKAKSSDHNTV